MTPRRVSRRAGIAAVLTVIAASAMITIALAVPSDLQEVDGNIVDNPAGGALDWSNINAGNGNHAVNPPTGNPDLNGVLGTLPTGTVAATFIVDKLAFDPL